MRKGTGGGRTGSSRSLRKEHKGRRRWLSQALIGAAVLLSAVLLYRTLSGYDFDDLVESVRSVPSSSLLAALSWAAASYFCLTFNDWIALRYVDRPLSYRSAAMTSFIALSFGHNVGFAALSSGAIRYHFYSRRGLDGGEVAKLIVFCGTTIFLGMFVLGAFALLFRPDFGETMSGLSRGTFLAIGSGLLVAPLAFLLLAFRLHGPHQFIRWQLEIPRPPTAVAQIAIGTVNFLLVAACLHATVSASADVGYVEVLAAFIIANTVTIITHTPGGLGVIETVILLLLRRPELIGAVLIFRFVYYLVPLGLGSLLFAYVELHHRRAARAAKVHDGLAAQADGRATLPAQSLSMVQESDLPR